MKLKRLLLGSGIITAGIAVLLYKIPWHDRFIDITAREPSGWLGRLFYRDPKAHYKSFRHALDKLGLNPDDVLLDVCCGGGTLLKQALRTIHRAAGLDYSPDMVALAKENNAQAVAEGRLEVRLGDAGALPWDDATFDAVTNANALVFLPEPVKALRETHRVLKPGDRFAVVTTGKRRFAALLYAPWYAALALYTAGELAHMLREAGFTAVEAYSLDAEDLIGYGIKAEREKE
jgi:ubiquinone/menaquinone biosynthesis C-methylase UbiE